MPFKHHLIFRLTIFDACALAALAWGWQMGIVWPMFETDTSGICFVIVAVFLLGKASLFARCVKVSAAKNDQKAGEKLRLKPESFIAKSEHLSDMVEASTALGLVGTLIGLAMVIRSLDPAADYAASIELVKEGGSIAVNTSIVGALAGMWLNVGRRMLATATATMISDAESGK